MKALRSLLILSAIGIAALSFGDVASVTFDRPSLNGGATGIATGTITLTAGAPAGGVDVFLSDNGGGLVDLGGVTSVHFDEGDTVKTFTVSAPTLVASSTPVDITADDGGATATGTLNVNPLHATKLTLGAAAVQGNTVMVTITLNGPTAGNLDLDLSASTGLTFESSTATVPAGQRSVTAMLDISPTAPVTGNTLTATVHATAVGYTRTAFNTIPLSISTLTADSTTLASTESTTVHITLNATVTNNTTLTVGGATYLTVGTVTVPAGQNHVDITVTAKTTTKTRLQALRLTTPSNKSKSLSFTINP